MRWADNLAGRGVERNTYSILVGRTGRKRPLGSRLTWMENIKMVLIMMKWAYGVN
jgi:hypothetical protein